jgi:hypothetical protein
MSRNQRLGLLALVVVVAVGAFIIAKPGGSDDSKSTSSTTASNSGDGKAAPAAPTAPVVQKIQIKDGKPVGGVKGLKFKKGDDARIEVSVDKPHQLHLHGYDIEKEAKPSKPATFAFKADSEGEFELESHTNEHAGLEPVIAKVLVEPS